MIPGAVWIVRHRRWYVHWGHSDFVSPPASKSDPGKLANRYDFITAGASSFKLLKGPYVLTDCSLPRNKR